MRNVANSRHYRINALEKLLPKRPRNLCKGAISSHEGLMAEPPSKRDLYLHRSAAVTGDLKGFDSILEVVDSGQQGFEIDTIAIDQIDGESEFLVETERAANFDLL